MEDKQDSLQNVKAWDYTNRKEAGTCGEVRTQHYH